MKRFFFLAIVGVMLTGCGGQAAEKNPVVVMETSLGTIKIELFADKAPVTVKNFLSYVDDKFYDGTIFHRVISNFMIQGGGFETGLNEKPKTKDPIQNESAKGVSNERGTIAMARSNDLNSATCQFYINVVDNKKLDPLSYCAFGKVVEGMDVVDKIKDVKTVIKVGTVKSGEKTQMKDVPEEEVVIKSIRRAEK